LAAKQQNHKARKKKQHFWLQTTTAGVVDQLSPQARLPGPGCRVEAVRPLQVASFRGVALEDLFQLLETEPDIPSGKDDWRI